MSKSPKNNNRLFNRPHRDLIMASHSQGIIVLSFSKTVSCFDKRLLCLDNTMLCLEKCLLCSRNIMLCFKNCLLCLQIWATVPLSAQYLDIRTRQIVTRITKKCGSFQ